MASLLEPPAVRWLVEDVSTGGRLLNLPGARIASKRDPIELRIRRTSFRYRITMTEQRDPVSLTVDVVIENDRGEVLLMRRDTEPFKGSWVLPGGYVEAGETVEQAAVREVKEEVGLDVVLTRLLGVYSTPGRDPRGAVVSIAFSGRVVGGAFQPNAEARAIAWVKREEPRRAMGFDHATILADHWERRS